EMKEIRECVPPEQGKVDDEEEEVLENLKKLAVETAGEIQHPKNSEDVGSKEVETSVHVPSENEMSKVESKEKVREAEPKLIVEEQTLSLDDYEAVKECFDTPSRKIDEEVHIQTEKESLVELQSKECDRAFQENNSTELNEVFQEMKEIRECVPPEQGKVDDEEEEVLENLKKLAVETAGEIQHPKNSEDVGSKEVETSVHVPSENEMSKVESKEKVREAEPKLIVEEQTLSLDDYEAVKECFDTPNRKKDEEVHIQTEKEVLVELQSKECDRAFHENNSTKLKEIIQEMKKSRKCVPPEQGKVDDEEEEVLENLRKLAMETAGKRLHPKNNEDVGPKEVETSVHEPSENETSKERVNEAPAKLIVEELLTEALLIVEELVKEAQPKLIVEELVNEAQAKLIVEELSLSMDDYKAVKECFDTRNRRVRFTFDDENSVITLQGHKLQVIKATIRDMKRYCQVDYTKKEMAYALGRKYRTDVSNMPLKDLERKYDVKLRVPKVTFKKDYIFITGNRDAANAAFEEINWSLERSMQAQENMQKEIDKEQRKLRKNNANTENSKKEKKAEANESRIQNGDGKSMKGKNKIKENRYGLIKKKGKMNPRC
ncbi:hypothetical protein SK128_022250, partial [Halocaridina rubra]